MSKLDLDLEIFKNFYTTKRLAMDMSDGGGAFGFDVHHALEACYLIHHYQCDAILETGTNSGDTTEFLAKMFPSLPVLTCEIEQKYVDVACIRLDKYDNVNVYLQSSEKFLAQYSHKFNLPFVFLDAHWQDYWRGSVNPVTKWVNLDWIGKIGMYKAILYAPAIIELSQITIEKILKE